MTPEANVTCAARFRAEYGAHREAEGRGLTSADALALPYLSSGPFARQWTVRARSFDGLVQTVLLPAIAECARPLSVLDLGAGNGWLSYRAALAGNDALAVDVREDSLDGLGAGNCYQERTPGRFQRVVASFDALPLEYASFDVAVFNAALHYALDLTAALREAVRVLRTGGRLVILDSPFYASEADGAAMVADKHRDAELCFGNRADALLALPFVEYLTRDRLEAASAGLGLAWRRHRIRYPLWYEARPLIAWLRRQRSPSRFDLWETAVA